MKRWALLVVFAVGCGDPDPNAAKPKPPSANDPAFAVAGLHDWYLAGDVATPGQDDMAMVVTPPGGTDFVDVYVADLPVQRMGKQSDGFGIELSIKDVPIGTHEILWTANGSDTAFAKVTFQRSAPYYVMVSTDYDFSEPGMNSTAYMDMIHQAHPSLKITHFWPPYTYTDPAVTDARRAQLTTWIQTQRDMFGDEIGLHIHPYCNFVTDAGLTCITDQSTVYPAGDDTGYTIRFNAYDRTAAGTLLQHAKDIFNAHGLGTPKTFRAGGWTADLSSLQALGDTGFIADSSALNWARIEEWKGYALYDWNMEHWATIDDTSQPYYPSNTDVLMSTPGSDMGLLEVPVNGVMMDYVNTMQLQMMFDENWDGTPLTEPHVIMTGFHPSTTLPGADQTYMTKFLNLADLHLAKDGLGPVVYITLSELTPVFPEQ